MSRALIATAKSRFLSNHMVASKLHRQNLASSYKVVQTRDMQAISYLARMLLRLLSNDMFRLRVWYVLQRLLQP